MNTQNRPQGGLASNMWLQFTLLAIAVVALIALAATYIW
jgi:hypothetical protein